MDLCIRSALGAAPQHAFEHDLRDVVGDFRRRPIRIGPWQAAELVAAEPRHIGRGAGHVARQAPGAQRAGNAEPAEMSSSWSPCTSNTGGRDLISAANFSALASGGTTSRPE